MLDTVFDGRLIFPPVAAVGDVLDCGYGAASWAIDVAENYPDATVNENPMHYQNSTANAP